MKFDILAIVAFAVAAAGASVPYGGAKQSSLSIDEAKAYCPGGDIACCQNTEVIKGDGVLGNLLAKGILNNLLGVGDSACAKTSLIENLNILGMSGIHGVSSLISLLIFRRPHQRGSEWRSVYQRHCLLRWR